MLKTLIQKLLRKDLSLSERTEQYNQNQSFLKLKNHKENFQNNPISRLINPEKWETEIISKYCIDQIHKSIREKLKINQWRNAQVVVTWFKNIKSKSRSFLINFDIVDFCPSISKDFLLKAINFAKSVRPTQDKSIATRLHSYKALLFNKNDAWVKKENPDFDVTMGSCDEAEVCELVGLYILDILTKEFSHNKNWQILSLQKR